MFEIPMSQNDPPREFRIFANGINRTAKGDLLWDDKAAASVMSEYRQRGTELHISYEHKDLDPGAPDAPAAGWFVPEIRDGELWATKVRWTPRAAAMLRAKEYRYHSPAVQFDKATRRVLRLVSETLTNLPASFYQAPLVAAREQLALTERHHARSARRRTMRDLIQPLEKLSNALGPDGSRLLAPHIEMLKDAIMRGQGVEQLAEQMHERVLRLKAIFETAENAPQFQQVLNTFDPAYNGSGPVAVSMDPSYYDAVCGPARPDPRRPDSITKPTDAATPDEVRAVAEPPPVTLSEREKRLCAKYGTDPAKILAAKQRWLAREAERAKRYE